MKDRRFVDELDVEELERILLIKRREARLARLRQGGDADQTVGRDPLEPPPPPSVPPPVSTAHREFRGLGASATYRSVEVEDRRQWMLGRRLAKWLSAPLRINWSFVFRGVLFLIEAAAVIGLVLIVLNTLRQQEEINEAAQVLAATPTATTVPTAVPLRKAVVLPGGHTPPDPNGFSEPASLSSEQQTELARITPPPVPTPGPEHATRLLIPSIGVDHPVVQGDDWEALKRGIGHTLWSANPGASGNCVLSAHNDIFGSIFRRLPDIALGDELLVYTGEKVYRYIVKATHIVEPMDTGVMETTDQPTLTLISSYPYLIDDKRIVVIAEMIAP
jgi:sortase A